MRRVIITGLIIFGFTLHGFTQAGFTQEGNAGIYALSFEGKTTASGEKYGFRKATCAHLNLSFGTLIKVTNLTNKLSVIVRVNDRGPFVPDRIIDLSKSAAEKLGFPKEGIARVAIEVVEEGGKPEVMPLAVTDTSKIVTMEEKSRAKESVKEAVEPKETATPVDNEFYDLKISKINPEGFAIQIGGYKELANLLKIADEAKVSLKKDTYVLVTTVNGEKIYKLMVGGFKNRSDAESLKEKVAKFYPGCFILELKKE